MRCAKPSLSAGSVRFKVGPDAIASPRSPGRRTGSIRSSTSTPLRISLRPSGFRRSRVRLSSRQRQCGAGASPRARPTGRSFAQQSLSELGQLGKLLLLVGDPRRIQIVIARARVGSGLFNQLLEILPGQRQFARPLQSASNPSSSPHSILSNPVSGSDQDLRHSSPRRERGQGPSATAQTPSPTSNSMCLLRHNLTQLTDCRFPLRVNPLPQGHLPP